METYVFVYFFEGPPWALRPEISDPSFKVEIVPEGRYHYLKHSCDPANISRDIDTLFKALERAIQPPARGTSSGKRRT